MSTTKARWDLSDIELSESAQEASLRVVERMTRERDELSRQWATVVWLAHANGASLRQIADVAGVSPQTVANLVKAGRPKAS